MLWSYYRKLMILNRVSTYHHHYLHHDQRQFDHYYYFNKHTQPVSSLIIHHFSSSLSSPLIIHHLSFINYHQRSFIFRCFHIGMKFYAVGIVRAILPNLRNRLSKVRVAAITAIHFCMIVPDRAKRKAAGMIIMMMDVVIRRKNVYKTELLCEEWFQR